MRDDEMKAGVFSIRTTGCVTNKNSKPTSLIFCEPRRFTTSCIVVKAALTDTKDVPPLRPGANVPVKEAHAKSQGKKREVFYYSRFTIYDLLIVFRFTTAGESHGRALVAIVEGLPAGLAVEIEQINHELWRRQQGYGRGARMKIEQDRVEILSGVRHGLTLGSPLALLIENKD